MALYVISVVSAIIANTLSDCCMVSYPYILSTYLVAWHGKPFVFTISFSYYV